MTETLLLTIGLIVLSAVIAIILRKVKRDKCLKDFENDIITLEGVTGKALKGRLTVRNTGLEFRFTRPVLEDGFEYPLLSFLLYKFEYSSIQALIRYHEDLSAEGRQERERELKRTFKPSRLRRAVRKIRNFFRTIKDSLIEIINLLTNQLSKTSPSASVLSSQEKYISRMKNEVYGTIETSFEPLLEEYIGERVILELSKGDNRYRYNGILKEYTAEFIEIIDVDYRQPEKGLLRKADLVVSRKFGLVRNLSE